MRNIITIISLFPFVNLPTLLINSSIVLKSLDIFAAQNKKAFRLLLARDEKPFIPRFHSTWIKLI